MSFAVFGGPHLLTLARGAAGVVTEEMPVAPLRAWTERLAGLATAEERWAALPGHLARERGLSRVDEGVDDIADPYRQPQEAFDAMAAEVDAAVQGIVDFERMFT